LFIGTQFSNLYTTVDTPVKGRVGSEEDLPPYHVVGGNTRFFQDLTTTLNVPQRFPFIAKGAIRGILFTPLVKEGTTGKL
jgi:hypothetical protein